jgi:hypothetical protein
MFNTDNGTSILDVNSYHKSDSANQDCLVKSETMHVSGADEKVNAVSLVATLDVSTDSTKECLLHCNKSQSSLHKLFTAKSNTGSGNRIKTAAAGTKSRTKAFCWSHNKFGFQGSKNITSLNRSDALTKDFKNPFRKTDSSPKDKSVQQATDCTSASSLLSVEEEEEMEDDPSSADSGLELGTSASPRQQSTSSEISDVGSSACV